MINDILLKTNNNRMETKNQPNRDYSVTVDGDEWLSIVTESLAPTVCF